MEDRKNVLQVQEGRDVVAAFNVKKVVVGRGHDMGGLIADVYFGKKKVATYHDDGWGGEPEVHFVSKEVEAEVEKFLKEKNFAQIMFDNGWAFMDEVSKINFRTQFDNVVEERTNMHLEEKEAKKFANQIKRECKKRIVYGTNASYRSTGWKQIKVLADILKFNNGLDALQKAYDNVGAKLEKDEKILNDQKELKAMGVKTNAKFH